ncbi:hypothetical protein ACFFWD_36235 [Bradyrhizobium erythrophlei]|uniref:hypothetical protein n=1 Tax=Bradyrhizobium erythrophlei TaxID=1437360 RepID=UPI0035E994DA
MINIIALRPGDRLQLRGHIIAEVTENMEDGMWVEVRYVEASEAKDVGRVELCHAQDIATVLTGSQAL